eukprot:gene16796-19954_t
MATVSCKTIVRSNKVVASQAPVLGSKPVLRAAAKAPSKACSFKSLSAFQGQAMVEKAKRSTVSRRNMEVSAGSVETTTGLGDLPMVKITGDDGSSAEAYLFGGVVTSWKPAGGDDVLYVRPDAKFDKSKPISGGLPHCFPQFGPGTTDGAEPSVEMTLSPSDYSKAMWDKEFKATQTITLSEGKLTATLKVMNTGDEEFDFTASFHTYFAADIEKVAVSGLDGLKVTDRLAEKDSTQEGDVAIAGPVDSVYYDSGEMGLETGAAKVTIGSAGWTDAVVWSPWSDMDCYKEFVCVENAVVGAPAVVPGGGEWSATTTLSV